MKSRVRVAVAVLVIAVVAAAPFFVDLDGLWLYGVAWMQTLGAFAEGAFVLLYLAASVLLLPSTMLDVGAGAIFGVLRGTIVVSLASLAGATACFVLARVVGREWLLRRLAADPRFHRLDEAVRREGWKIVLLARLSPIFPFWLLNYGFGLTRLPLGHFILATWVGMLPLVIVYVWTGSLLLDVASSRGTGALEWALFAAGATATVALTVVVTRMARRALV